MHWLKLIKGLPIKILKDTGCLLGGCSLVLLLLLPARAGNITSAQTGAWSLPSTWAGGVVPTVNDSVTIAVGHTVTIDLMTAVSSTAIIKGALMASRLVSSSWTLVGGDVTVNAGGTLDYGNETSPLPAGTTAHLVLAYGSSAGQYGLIVDDGGNFSVRGATKTPYAYATESITAAQTYLKVYGSTSTDGWQAGDVITIGPALGSGATATSSRTITSIDASAAPVYTVNWSGGVLPQARLLSPLSPIMIGNLTRNVLVRSSGTDVNANSAYIQNLARNATSFALTYGEFAHLGVNVAGKFGITFDGAMTKGSVSSSTVRDGSTGIYLNASSGIGLTGNNAYSNFNNGVSLNGSNNTLAGNNIYSNGYSNIFLGGANNILTGNNSYSCVNFSIYFYYSDNNILTGNNSYASGDGVLFQGGSNNTLTRNNFYSNGNGIFILNSGSSISNILTGNNFYSNNAGIYINGSSNSNNVLTGNNIYSNSSYGIHLRDASNNAFIDGNLGYNAAGDNLKNASAEIYIEPGTPATPETLILKGARVNPATGISTAGMDVPGTALISYSQDHDTGTVRIWGNYQMAGSTLTLDHAALLYTSTATAPKLMRGAGHSASVVSTNDTYAVSQLITITFDAGGPYWRVEGSSSGLLSTFTGSLVNQSFPAANPQFKLTFNEGASFDGDTVDFVLTAASNDVSIRKKLLFGPSAATFNQGRSKLEVGPTGGIVLRGKTDGTANTLVDRLDASSTYYTFVDSGAFTAAFSSFTNMDPGGIQLSGSAGVAISSSTFDYLGFASGTNSYITARDLISNATFDNVAFKLSRSSAGYDSAHNVRVEGGGAGLNLLFAKSRFSLGPLWGEDYDDDPGAKVSWSDYAPGVPGCDSGFNVKADGAGDYAFLQPAVDALDHNLTSDTCVVIRDTQTYSEQVTVQGFTTNGFRLKIMADPTFVSSAPTVNPPLASTAAFRIMNDSVTLQGVMVVPTSAVPYGIVSSSADVAVSSVMVVGGAGINVAGIVLSSRNTLSNSLVIVDNANGIYLPNTAWTSISDSTAQANGASHYALHIMSGSSNTFTRGVLRGLAYMGARVYNSSSNMISQSTISASSTGILFENNAAYNTVTGSSVTSSANNGVTFYGSNYNTVSQSTVTGSSMGFWFMSGASSNTVTQSVVNGSGGFAAFFSDSARFNTVSYSSISNNSAGSATVMFSGAPGTEYSNTVAGSFVGNSGTGVAIQFEPGAKWNTVDYSTVTSGGAGLYFNGSSSNTVTNSYVRGFLSAYVLGSTGTVINSSVLTASDPSAPALMLSSGSLNLSLSSNTFIGGSLGAGVYLQEYNFGVMDLSSNTILGGKYGLYVSTQSAGAVLSVTSMTFSSLAAGATAVNFLGGQFVSTFTGVSFDDAGIAVNVNGSQLAPGSRVRIADYAGARGGPAFENDPYGYVEWGYPPAAVADLAGVVVSTGNITLGWTSPGADGMTGVLNNSTFTIQYTSVAVDAQSPVFWSTAAAQVSLSTTGVAPGTSQYYALSGLNANTSYYFRLWTDDEIENYSALSNGATAATLADQPAGPLVAGVFFTSVTVSWTALPASPSSATCEGYLVQASTSAGFTGTVLSSSTPDSQRSSLAVENLSQGSTYYFRAGSLNWSGAANYGGAALSTTTLDNSPPAAVATLDGVAVASDTVELNWPSPGGNGGAGTLNGAFTIQYTSAAADALDPVFWSTAAAAQVTVVSTAGVQPGELQAYNIENLLSGVTYYFRLWTNDDSANLSPLSDGATVVMPPSPPSSPQVLGVSSDTMSVSWTGNGTTGSFYLAEAANDEAFTLNSVSTVTTGTAYTFTGLFPNAGYFTRLKTLGGNTIDSDFIYFADTATLSAQVTAPDFVNVFATSATLSWTDGVNPEGTLYEVSVSSDSFSTLNYSSANVQVPFTATALAPDTTYYFRTATLNSAGGRSDYVVFPSTLTRAAVPVPHAVVFSSVTTDKVEVQWLQNGNPASVEYLLQVSTASNFAGQSDITWGWSAWISAVTVTPLDSGVTFYFQVKARDSLQRETGWAYLGVKRTDLGVDNAPPSVINMQGGDDAWRGAASGSYKVRFHDGGAGLAKFEVKLSTSQNLAGTPLTGWAEVVTNINAADYVTDWQLPLTAFQAIPEGVTAYVSVRVYDAAAPTPNITVSTDVFYVVRDTTPPTIANNAASPSGWQFADPGVFDVNFADARSGLAAIQYSASGSAGAVDEAILGWTDIDTLVSSSSYAADWGVAFALLTGGATNYISVRAVDAAGNATTLADAFRIMKAAGSPIVALTSPSAAYVSSAASLSGSAYGGSDGITINYVEVWLRNLANGLYYDGAAGTFTAGAPVWLRASGAESWALDISTFGTVNLSSYTAVARTLDSVARYSLVYATVTFTLDQDAPSVYLSSPVAQSTVSVFDVMTGTAADTGSGPALAGVSVKRVIDGKWWDFTNRVWGSAQVSSMTPVAGGSWTFLPDVYLRGNVSSGYDYFATAYAADAAAPANVSVFGLTGSTFTFADTTPPGAAATVYASTDPETSLPGKMRVTWVFPGDDGSTGMLGAGAFAIQRSTFAGFSFSTASAQVVESTASILAGATQSYVLSGLANSTTYYLRVWTRDDAGLWSAVSPEFMGVSGEGLPDEIAGHVRTALGQGITGVFVEAFYSLGPAERSAYTVNDTSGSFRLTSLANLIYRIQATWTENGIASSVAKDGILTGYADADFTLSVNYTLGSISGTLPLSVSGRRASSFSPSGAAGAVELWQSGRRIVTVQPEADGSFRISNMLPGDYELRGPGMAPMQLRLRSGENLVVRPSAEIILGESVYAYPNPARARVTFRLQTEAASGKDEINVFDVSGRLVKTITHEDPAWDRSNPYNIRWATWDFTGSRVASGVYIYKVNMRSGVTGKTKVKTGKFAIVR